MKNQNDRYYFTTWLFSQNFKNNFQILDFDT